MAFLSLNLSSKCSLTFSHGVHFGPFWRFLSVFSIHSFFFFISFKSRDTASKWRRHRVFVVFKCFMRFGRWAICRFDVVHFFKKANHFKSQEKKHEMLAIKCWSISWRCFFCRCVAPHTHFVHFNRDLCDYNLFGLNRVFRIEYNHVSKPMSYLRFNFFFSFEMHIGM